MPGASVGIERANIIEQLRDDAPRSMLARCNPIDDSTEMPALQSRRFLGPLPLVIQGFGLPLAANGGQGPDQ